MTGPFGPRAVHEVRRQQDDELEGYVEAVHDGWHALTVFGGLLATFDSQVAAVELVRRQGLASLAERWSWWSRDLGAWRIVLPQEASPGRVQVAIGYYSLPGVETAVITAADLAAGDRLTLAPPPGEAVEG